MDFPSRLNGPHSPHMSISSKGLALQNLLIGMTLFLFKSNMNLEKIKEIGQDKLVKLKELFMVSIFSQSPLSN